jgi:TonB family protein
VQFASLAVVAMLGCGSASAPAPAYGGEIAPSEIEPVSDGPPFVEPGAMNRRRIAGEKLVIPDDDTLAVARRTGTTLQGLYKYCVDASGAVISVSVVHSTGAPSYDARIMHTMQAWEFKPVVFQGAVIVACSVQSFAFSVR